MKSELEADAKVEVVEVAPKRSVRSNRMRDLGDAVEQIISQEESSDAEDGNTTKEVVAVTPRHNSSKATSNENMIAAGNYVLGAATPRRSTRKSVKPVQEYEEIVGRNRQLRSISKLKVDQSDDTTDGGVEAIQPKWTPAKVGRVSQKRGRKNRKTAADNNKKKEVNSSENEDVQEKAARTIEISDPENKENEQPEEMEIVKTDENMKIADELQLEKGEELKNRSSSGGLKEINLQISELGLKLLDDDNSLEDSTEGNKVEEVEVATEDNKVKETEEVTEDNKVEEAEVATEDKKVEETEVATEDKKVEETEVATEDKKVEGAEVATEDNKYEETEVAVEELPSDGGNDDMETEEPQPEQGVITVNDDTFNASDCIMVSSDVCAVTGEENMQTLQISDDECDETSSSPPRKGPRIVITTEDNVQETIFSASTCEDRTPKRLSKTSSRLPTPYKPMENVEHDCNGNGDGDGDDDDDSDMETDVFLPSTSIVSIEPKECVLRSIRKRSLSICIGDTADKLRTKSKNVTFYSPANQTMILEELNPAVEQKNIKKPLDKAAQNNSFVTERRRRSKSFDESMLKKPTKPTKTNSAGTTPKKACPTPQKTAPFRSKLPNFAAIHQKQFENMENLLDHVNRKKERAKVLINSAIKTRPASANKVQPQNNSRIPTTLNAEKSKAFKKINLDIPTKPSNATFTTTLDEQQAILNTKLPNPLLGTIKSVTVNTIKGKNKQLTPAKNRVNPVPSRPAPPLRPAFNLSTTMQSHNVKISTAQCPVTSTLTTFEGVPSQTITFNEKLATRRQRHMDMFKGRVESARATASRADRQIIRGVRSNRRFELQMQHRLNMDHQ